MKSMIIASLILASGVASAAQTNLTKKTYPTALKAARAGASYVMSRTAASKITPDDLTYQKLIKKTATSRTYSMTGYIEGSAETSYSVDEKVQKVKGGWKARTDGTAEYSFNE